LSAPSDPGRRVCRAADARSTATAHRKVRTVQPCSGLQLDNAGAP
jgi:hypothetical protein